MWFQFRFAVHLILARVPELGSLDHIERMASTETKQLRAPAFIYPIVVTACIAHALAFGVSPWLSIWDIPHGPQIWFAILGTWPVWVFPLWLC